MDDLRRRILIPRAMLLIEIERRCAAAGCCARNRLGLTKQEAREYHGFACAKCERWTEDVLIKRDVPEWWEELMVTTLGDKVLRAQIIGEEEGDRR